MEEALQTQALAEGRDDVAGAGAAAFGECVLLGIECAAGDAGGGQSGDLSHGPGGLALRCCGGLAFAAGLAGEYVADFHARLCGTDLRARFCDGLVSSMGRLGGAAGDVHFVPGLFLASYAGGTETGMKAQAQMKLAGLAIAFLTAWNARALFEAWRHSPFDRADAVAWVIWMAPVVASLLGSGEASLGWLIATLAISMAGAFLELNLAKQIGFAVACAGTNRGTDELLALAAGGPELDAGARLVHQRFGNNNGRGLRVALAAAGTTAYFSKR